MNGKPLYEVGYYFNISSIELFVVLWSGSVSLGKKELYFFYLEKLLYSQDYENFESYICEAYSGTSVPEACSELSISAVVQKYSVQKHWVCYKESSPFIFQVREAVASLMRWINVVG